MELKKDHDHISSMNQNGRLHTLKGKLGRGAIQKDPMRLNY